MRTKIYAFQRLRFFLEPRRLLALSYSYLATKSLDFYLWGLLRALTLLVNSNPLNRSMRGGKRFILYISARFLPCACMNAWYYTGK